MQKFLPFALIMLPLLFMSCPKETEADFSGVSLDLRTAVIGGTAVNVPSDFAGMCHAGYSNNLEREYAMLDEMNVVWLHRDFSWSSIERNEGEFNFSGFDAYVQKANAEERKVMGMLLYDVGWVHTKHGNPGDRRIWPNEIPDFCNYAVKTVERYNGLNGYGKVDAWLIWNEPDLAPRFWTDPKSDPDAIVDFFALTKATAEAVRALDAEKGTNTTLIGGVFTALSSDAWVKGLFEYEDGAIKDLIDGVAYHPYSPLPIGAANVSMSLMERVAPYGFAGKVWINEMGYPTYSERGPIPSGRYGTDQYEGDMPEVVAKTFTLLAVAKVRSLTWYHLFDGANRKDSDSEDWFGLVWRKNDDEWIKKGGYWAYSICAQHLPGKQYQSLTFSGSVPEDIETYYFAGDNGSRALLVWNSNPVQAVEVQASFNGSNHRLWNVETGESESVDKTSTHKLNPI
ncbi:MAG: beta-galactosidase, partial [Treponema sp.]|nr:beta-galactosidase [Treponema sp.]